MSMRLRYTTSYSGRIYWLELCVTRDGGSWIGTIERPKEKPYVYRAALRGTKRKHHSTNLRRAKAWLRDQAAAELQALGAREGRR